MSESRHFPTAQLEVCLRARRSPIWPMSISPGLAKAALAAKVGDRLVDLSYPLTADTPIQIITSKNPTEALPLYRHSTAHLLAAAVTNMFPGVQCGIGPPTDEGFFYDFVVPRPFVPEDLEAIEKKMRELADQDLDLRAAAVAAGRSQAVLHRPRRAAQGAADRGEDRRTDARVLLHDQGQGDVRRFLRRTSRAVHGQAEGVQAVEHVERVLEGRRAQSADAARLRDGVFLREGAAGSPAPDRGGQEARSPEGRPRPAPVHVPPVGAGRDVLAAERDGALQHARQLHAWCPDPGRLHRGEGADRLQQGPLGDVRALAALSREHVPRRVRRRADGPQGDELPRALPDVRQRGTQLPGPADPLSRADAAPSERGVRRADRADARSAVQPGRRALLRHGVADRRARWSACSASSSGSTTTSAWSTQIKLSTRPRGVHGDDRDVESRGSRAEGGARPRPASRTRSTKATARSTAPRSISTSPTRSAGSGSAPRSSSIT